jgi:hypothetical protein
VRRNLDVEDSDLGVGESLVVMGLSGDFDVGLGLRGEKSSQEEKQETTMHSRIVASRWKRAVWRIRAYRAAGDALMQANSRFLPSVGMTRIWSDTDSVGMTTI